jgi:hypothetical protein
MDGDLQYKNTKIEQMKKESNFLRGDLKKEMDNDEY